MVFIQLTLYQVKSRSRKNWKVHWTLIVHSTSVLKTESGKEIKKVSITVPANSNEATYVGDELKNLPRGTYTVSEEDSDGYVLTDYQVGDSTNCRNTSDAQNESVTFKLGYEKTAGSDDKDVDVIKNYTYNQNSGGTVGSVTFTNVKATKDGIS